MVRLRPVWMTITTLLQCFDTVCWVIRPVKHRLRSDLNCVEWDVKPCWSQLSQWHAVFQSAIITRYTVYLLTYIHWYEIHVMSAYNDRVLAFLRQPNMMDLIKERNQEMWNNTQLKNKITLICMDGIPTLERFANDVDLITLLRWFDGPV